MKSTTASRVNFALCWHMHQPWYQQGIDGDYQLPWVYLHAIKDYDDMAAHLEAHPKMKLTVNFAPVLLEQLDDYAVQLKGWLDSGVRMRDPQLNLLAGVTEIPQDLHGRYQVLCDCQRAYAPKLIDPYPVFKALLEPFSYMYPGRNCIEKDTGFLDYLKPQYFIDVLVWYHLAWLGHELKQTKTAQRLIKKELQFDAADRRELIELIHDCIAGLIPRYRKLAEKGQIELSMTPYGHPIIPLLNDFSNMDCAQPDAPAPDVDIYPDGPARSRWHLEKGIECFERYFGIRPKGVWLSEGAISEDAIALIEEYGFTWTASGEGVWRNSMRISKKVQREHIESKRALFHPYQLGKHKPRIFFRDDGMSDLVGFEYSKRDSIEAADDLVQNLVNIADFLGDSAHRHVVSIILDGENAWEYYPHNGYPFLNHLYAKLSNHKRVKAEHFSKLTKQPMCQKFDRLCPGSWVYGSFSTWIGEPDKNRAWELLVAAKQAYDKVVAKGRLDEATLTKATKQLAICEGSDWFWWFGGYNPAGSVSDFDRLYRVQLKNLYCFLGLAAPGNLDTPVSVGGGGAENSGTMRRNVG
jgi:alpha-amylase/alpha-mannosidase (GH57 family)